MVLQETFLNIRGTKIQMLKGGSGDSLLYLHSGSGEIVELPFFTQLAQHYTVYIPAHPGFSQSEGLEKIDTIEDFVFHYTDLMDHLGLTQPYVAGLSLGGWLATELACRYPQRIHKLALINAAGLRVPGSQIADIFAATPAETRNLIFYDPHSGLAKMFVPDVTSPRVRWNPYLCNPKLRDRLYLVTVPTLVLWGASDRLIPVAHGKAYHEGINGSKFVLIEKCGHAPPFEKPEETVKILREFFHG